MGEIVRGSGLSPLASDLTHLFMPGMAALGIEARLVPLPQAETDIALYSGRSGGNILFGFAAPLEFAQPEEIDDATPLPRNDDPQITAQRLFVEATENGVRRENAAGDAGWEDAATFRARFSHVLLLDRFATKVLRRVGTRTALHRWSAWHAAYPDRAPREGDLADPVCESAAAFLLEVVGTRRDFVSNRLRSAARCFEAARIECAYGHLREAGVAAYELPATMAQALLTDPSLPLSDVLRREAIYLARAGTPVLKTLAARRLTYERHQLDARKTLHQLRFDPDPWVRAAARPEPA